MVQLVQLRNNLLAVLLIGIGGCYIPAKQFDMPNLLLINSDSGVLTNQNGIKYLNDSLFSGTVFTLFPNTKDTSIISCYLNGKEHGLWKKFYSSGVLNEIRNFENGKKIGRYNTWWENGKLQQQFNLKDDEYEGTCKEWNSNGILIRSMNYKKGYEVGQQQLFYDNGKIRSNYFIVNGRRYGLLGTKNCVNVSDSIFNKR